MGFDAGADIGAARLLTALKTVIHEWSPELLQQRRCAGPTSRPGRPEGMR